MTSRTARSVMIRWTTPRPVSGRCTRRRSCSEPSLATCSISTMTRLAPWTRSIAPPMPLTILPGIIQLAMSPVGRDLHRAEDRGVDLAAADHPERRSRSRRTTRPGSSVTVSLPALIRSGSSSPSTGYGADAEDAVLATAAPRSTSSGDVVGHQRRQADAEVDVRAVGQLARRPGRPSAHGSAPCQALPSRGRTVRFSIRLSAACSGVSGDHALHEDARAGGRRRGRARRARPAPRPRRS